MNILLFKQHDTDPNGKCDAYLNGVHIDSCDMNHVQKYTQAHVVLASAQRTLQTRDIEVQIIGTNPVGRYDVEKLKAMAWYQISDTFEDNYGYTRIYEQMYHMSA